LALRSERSESIARSGRRVAAQALRWSRPWCERDRCDGGEPGLLWAHMAATEVSMDLALRGELDRQTGSLSSADRHRERPRVCRIFLGESCRDEVRVYCLETVPPKGWQLTCLVSRRPASGA
jgi:hypothetical protein